MQTDYTYDIWAFRWNKESNTLSASAWQLFSLNHPDLQEPFPTQKEQFIIKNNETGGFRRFRFQQEKRYELEIEEGCYAELIDWVFESEDGIKCVINVYEG